MMDIKLNMPNGRKINNNLQNQISNLNKYLYRKAYNKKSNIFVGKIILKLTLIYINYWEFSFRSWVQK